MNGLQTEFFGYVWNINDVYSYKTLRRQSHENSPSKTFIRLFTLPCKRQGKAGDWVSEVQLVLCEDAMCLKRIIVMEICEKIV